MNALRDIATNPHQPLIDQLYREEILRARAQTPQERLRGTFEVTKFALRLMRDHLRNRHPHADDAELVHLGRERLGKVRRMDEMRRYRAGPPPE